MVDLNLQKYPVYKISGIEWLGDIPEHWEVKKAKYISKIFVPQRNKPELNLGSGLPWITMDDITNSTVNKFNSNYCVSELSALKAGSKPLISGSVIASCVGNFGVASINTNSVIINQQLQAYIPKNINPWFLRYVVIVSKTYFEKVATVTTLVYLNKEGFGEMPVPFPPLSEQQAIANFLDDKLAQIDEYIAKKQRMIELLKEQKTVIINQAVTKGINPDVPMKYSGIKWLGEIPENWEVKRLKFISHLVYGDSLGSENREDGNINVYGSNGMIGLHSKANTLSPVIIVGRKGSFGKIQYSLFPCFCIDTAYFIDQRKTKQNLKWLYYALQILELDKISQDTGVPGLSREKAYQKLVPLPPLSEQQAIANFLDDKLVKIDKCITVIEKEIKLTQEYRTTLISETVTGKIDVRKYHPPQ